MRTISLKLPEELGRRLDSAAAQRGQSKSEVVRNALEQFLLKKPIQPSPGSLLERAGDLVGCLNGPGDLSTNKKYLRNFGK